MIKFLIFILLVVMQDVTAQAPIFKDKFNQTIKVLNFGTFHMGYTNDATSVEFDENDAKNKAEVHKIAKLLAEFKPTVIIVERHHLIILLYKNRIKLTSRIQK